MKSIKYILLFALGIIIMASCDSFLEEKPKTFLSPESYFTTEAQMEAAVDGLYSYMDDIFDGDIEVGTQRFVFLEYMTGYCTRKRQATSLYLEQANSLTVTEENNNLESLWSSAYHALENCNVAIAGIEKSTAQVPASSKNNLLGQAYFFRAYYYFNLVRLWGEIPLKITPTTNLLNTAIELSSQSDVYNQIVADLKKAEELMKDLQWSNSDGHVAKAAVKSLLAKVYITMAGYPLQLGKEYYDLAYSEAKDVVTNSGISLYPSFQAMRDDNFACGGENILTIEREPDKASSPVHSALLPYPEVANISQNSAYGGALAPTESFYDSYSEYDLRKADFGYMTKKYNALDGTEEINTDVPYIYKYFDMSAANNAGKSGMGYPIIRYADILLLMAEAKTMSDGGTTTDTDAINAYWQVRQRAIPASAEESKPSSLTFETAYKERIWELCFETQTWFDMLRTRKALDTTSGKVIDLIGLQTPGHSSPFEEKDLLFPYPLREKRLNPNLVRK